MFISPYIICFIHHTLCCGGSEGIATVCIQTLASRSALTLPLSIISTDLQVTDKAYNIRSKPPEHTIALIFASASPPQFNPPFSYS